jgi:hypothetical protein
MGYAAKNEFAQAIVAVGTRNYQIGALLLSNSIKQRSVVSY